MKTPAETKITYKKNGNIKKVVTPYDNDEILQSSFKELEYKQNHEQTLGEYNKEILNEMFFRFGSPYTDSL